MPPAQPPIWLWFLLTLAHKTITIAIFLLVRLPRMKNGEIGPYEKYVPNAASYFSAVNETGYFIARGLSTEEFLCYYSCTLSDRPRQNTLFKGRCNGSKVSL